MGKALVITLAALAIAGAAPSHADPTDPTDIAFIRSIISWNVPILKSEDDMVKRGQGIASYLSQHLNEDGIDTVFQNNERDGFRLGAVDMLTINAAHFYAPDNQIAITQLVRQHVAAHPEEQNPYR
jgi:hypothetical protein